jgi:hypothetical protein
MESGKISGIYGAFLGSASDRNDSSEVGRVVEEWEESSYETDSGVVVQRCQKMKLFGRFYFRSAMFCVVWL